MKLIVIITNRPNANYIFHSKQKIAALLKIAALDAAGIKQKTFILQNNISVKEVLNFEDLKLCKQSQ